MRGCKAAATPVAFARAVGRPEETLTLTTLGEADAAVADMATLVIIGSSETRFVQRDGAASWMLTPRSYGARAMSRDPRQRRVEIVGGLRLGRRRAAEHHDLEPEHARRLDLGVGRLAAAVLGDEKVDRVRAHQRCFVGERNGPRARMSL